MDNSHVLKEMEASTLHWLEAGYCCAIVHNQSNPDLPMFGSAHLSSFRALVAATGSEAAVQALLDQAAGHGTCWDSRWNARAQYGWNKDGTELYRTLLR